ncbi:MAG: NAD-dependent epimerase/dehydratase family protein [Actinobacteria bacterium]|nr:NAD-dependent epimerase/dehydratase family protein [Actinomycetota bacterium]MBV9935110.1 NAD-dependent epimerase/dehydratase family protein [Actinomycetota bacterium]
MKVAVTGGAGFIGAHVVSALQRAGHEVVVLDVRPPADPGLAYEQVDIRDVDGLTRATAGCDAVFHLAAVADVDQAAKDPVGTVEKNVAGTAAVWEACRRNEVKRAILASTVWVYTAATGPGPFDETAVFDASKAAHLYTSSKIAAEMVVHDYHALYGQDFTILRYGIPFGPGMRPALVISKFVDMAEANTPITVHGDGSQYRNYVYVEDLARAHVLALEPAGANEVFNLEGEEQVSVRGLVEAISAVLGRPLDVTFGDARPGDYAGAEISNAKAAAVLGWRPETTFEEGLRRYMASRPQPDEAEAPAVATAPAAAAVPADVPERVHVPMRGRVSVQAVVGLAVAAVAGWLLYQAPAGGATWAALLVLAAGAAVVFTAARAAAAIFRPRTTGAVAGDAPARRAVRPRVLVGTVAATSLVTVWVGATSASASWFGPVTSHAARATPAVALTVDVSSDVGAAAIGRALANAGATATFFTSGRALSSSAAVERKLMAQGHLIGSRSQRATSTEFFDPRFHGLRQAQQVFHDQLGVCPTFFEPVAGRHTPLVARAVRHQGMTAVTWDVVMADPATAGAANIRRVVGAARAGSIIHLNFDVDDAAGASRAQASLSQLLAGLNGKGLHAVRLDQLLNRPGYAGHC